MMRQVVKSIGILAAATVVAALLAAGVVQAQESLELPATFSANMVKPDPGSKAARITITVERWSTDAEREGLVKALQDRGTEGLVAAMHGLDVGYVQIRGSLAWRLRSASTWETEEGRFVRLATDRPILVQEKRKGTRSLEYPIGIIEFKLPPEGAGEGTLYEATRAKFNEAGQIELESMQQNTGPRRLLGVKQEKSRKKKKETESAPTE
jgi:hypothetical protein